MGPSAKVFDAPSRNWFERVGLVIAWIAMSLTADAASIPDGDEITRDGAALDEQSRKGRCPALEATASSLRPVRYVAARSVKRRGTVARPR